MESSWNDGGAQGGGFGRITPVVKKILIANCVIWLATFLFYAVTPDTVNVPVLDSLNNWLGLNVSEWSWWFPRVWQLVTYGFLHSLEPSHLLFNMLGLFFFGSMLEGIMGSRQFAAFYIASILVGGLAVLLWSLISPIGVPTIGASGGLMGVIVATALLRPRQRVIFVMFPVMLWVLAAFYVGTDLFRMVTAIKGDDGSVSFQCHLGGALFGFMAVRKGWIWKDPLQALEDWKAGRSAQQAVDDDKHLDEILAKINREGIQSLTAKEKAFLNRSSQRKSG